MKATDIITRVSTALFDVKNVRWTRAEVVGHINDSQPQIVLLRPDANAVTASLALVPGTRQRIPSAPFTDPTGFEAPTGMRFMRAVRNMGVDGATPGRAIREASAMALDNEMPGWHTASPSNTVQNAMFDNLTPTQFSVFPAIPTPSSAYIEIVYSGLPAEVEIDGNGEPTPATNELTLATEYRSALVNLVLARCYAKDSSYAGNMQRAGMHLQAAGNELQVTMDIGFMAASPQRASPMPAATPTTSGRR